MDVLAFLIGIILIVTSVTAISVYALTLHHMRVKEQLRQKEFTDLRKFQLIESMLDKGLPPGRFKIDDF